MLISSILISLNRRDKEAHSSSSISSEEMFLSLSRPIQRLEWLVGVCRLPRVSGRGPGAGAPGLLRGDGARTLVPGLHRLTQPQPSARRLCFLLGWLTHGRVYLT